MGDFTFNVEIESTVEDASHQPLEGVQVFFVKGSSEPAEVGTTNAAGFAAGRHTFIWGAQLGDPNPPPVTATLIYRKSGYQEVRHVIFVNQLPERDGFHFAELRVVLLRGREGGAV
jgi:hypothetical protein